MLLMGEAMRVWEQGVCGRDYEGRDDGYVHYFDRGDGFMNAYMCPNISVAYFECVQFIEY